MLYTLLSIQLTMKYLPIPAKAPKINKVMGPRGIFLLFRAKKATRKTPTAKRSGVVKEDKASCNNEMPATKIADTTTGLTPSSTRHTFVLEEKSITMNTLGISNEIVEQILQISCSLYIDIVFQTRANLTTLLSESRMITAISAMKSLSTWVLSSFLVTDRPAIAPAMPLAIMETRSSTSNDGMQP